jgi:methyltransferase, FkbM family
MIEVRRLSDVVRELNLRDPLLLKLDVQGFEDKVIAGGEDVVARAKIIIIEVSFQPLYEEVRCSTTSTGFSRSMVLCTMETSNSCLVQRMVASFRLMRSSAVNSGSDYSCPKLTE